MLGPNLTLSHRRLKGKSNPVLLVRSVLQFERHIVKYSTSDRRFFSIQLSIPVSLYAIKNVTLSQDP